MSDIDSVRVAVRIRPLVKSENDRGCQCIIDKVRDEPQVVFKNNDSFTFNYVYAPNFTQEFIYEEAVKSMIQKLFKGYNVTILAYGQTGSGKTHTMGTAFDGNFGPDTGVIPRAMYDIFKQIDDMNDYEFTVTCSFTELYQEQLYDLLSTAPREQSVIDIREDGNKGIIMPGLTETKVTTAKETTDCLIRGSMGRAVGATAMNAQSSRSHAIFTISIQMMKNGDTNSSTSSKFHLVDLAGSERSKKTKATGDRFKEGVKINQGLLALGNVISALGSSNTNAYVGYRDSKLTRLLQDSLGGNSYTLMIACVSPADYNMDETLSTLRYADRARKIKNKPVVNQDVKSVEINRLNGIIQKLRLELLSKGGSGGESGVAPSQELETMRKLIANLTEKNRCLQNQLHSMLSDVADIEMRAVVAETANEELFGKVLNVNKMIGDLYLDFNEETCSNDVLELAKKFTEIRNVMEEITGVVEKNRTEMIRQQETLSAASSTNNLSNLDELVPSEAMQKRSEDFTEQQLMHNNKLRTINAELGLMEALHKQIADKLAEIPTYEDRIKNFQSDIQVLELQKEDLAGQVKSNKGNISAKLAEERRIKLQNLEKQINDMRAQNLRQAKLLKEHEKDIEKMKNLANQIQNAKADKVRLIRQMRAESEKFRQWKLNREKELSKLKEKDRKRQNEMVRMESIHNKKENVLKSKVANALAANKRLKEALEKHKSAQSHRKNVASGKIDHLVSWIDQELEVIMSVVDAEYSIEHLMEDRAILTARMKKLKNSKNSNDAKDISTVEEEIQMRNAQISDLQQRVVSSNVESKIKTIVEGMQSMPEARAALKHLFNALMELRKEYAAKDKVEDLKNACEIADAKIAGLENEIQEKESRYKDELYWIERSYEEKITLLLRELNNCPRTNLDDMGEKTESQKIQEENLNKLEALRAELEDWKRRCTELQDHSFKRPRNRITDRLKMGLELSHSWLESENEEPYDDDAERDPDWKRTPLRSRHVSENNSRGAKRGSDGSMRCSCKGKCISKQCSCRKNSNVCSENCRCTEICENKLKDEENTSVEMNGTVEMSGSSNGSINIQSLGDKTIVLHKITPTKSMQSSEIIIDTDTPSYPFAKRPRKPLS